MKKNNVNKIMNYSGAKKYNIGLIVPPSAFLLDERVFVSLGVLKIGSALEQDGHIVHMLDLSGVVNYIEALKTFLVNTSATVIGITATTPQLPAVSDIAQAVRKIRPDIRLMLGGPHVTLSYAALKLEKKTKRTGFTRAAKAVAQLESMFDVLVSGDGERAVLAALDPANGKLIDGDDNHGPYFLSDEDLTNSPYPASSSHYGEKELSRRVGM